MQALDISPCNSKKLDENKYTENMDQKCKESLSHKHYVLENVTEGSNIESAALKMFKESILEDLTFKECNKDFVLQENDVFERMETVQKNNKSVIVRVNSITTESAKISDEYSSFITSVENSINAESYEHGKITALENSIVQEISFSEKSDKLLKETKSKMLNINSLLNEKESIANEIIRISEKAAQYCCKIISENNEPCIDLYRDTKVREDEGVKEWFSLQEFDVFELTDMLHKDLNKNLLPVSTLPVNESGRNFDGNVVITLDATKNKDIFAIGSIIHGIFVCDIDVKSKRSDVEYLTESSELELIETRVLNFECLRNKVFPEQNGETSLVYDIDVSSKELDAEYFVEEVGLKVIEEFGANFECSKNIVLSVDSKESYRENKSETLYQNAAVNHNNVISEQCLSSEINKFLHILKPEKPNKDVFTDTDVTKENLPKNFCLVEKYNDNNNCSLNVTTANILRMESSNLIQNSILRKTSVVPNPGVFEISSAVNYNKCDNKSNKDDNVEDQKGTNFNMDTTGEEIIEIEKQNYDDSNHPMVKKRKRKFGRWWGRFSKVFTACVSCKMQKS